MLARSERERQVELTTDPVPIMYRSLSDTLGGLLPALCEPEVVLRALVTVGEDLLLIDAEADLC